MDPIAIIAAGVQVVSITEQAISAIGTVTPEIMAIWGQWKTIGQKFAGGETITEAEVAKLRADLDVLSASNATDEDKIING